MKSIVATIAALFAATAFAQTPAPAAPKKEEAKPATAAPAATPAPAAKKEETKKCDPAKDKDCKAEKKAEPAKK